MASEDVIELGSSEDEAEPAPKKKKPVLNAMVHIPTKLPGITIKPAKSSSTLGPRFINNTSKGLNMQKGILSRPIVIANKNNINFASNVNKQRANFIPGRVPSVNKNYPKNAKIISSIPNRFSINPVSIAKNLPRPQIVKKIAIPKRVKNPLEAPRLLNALPPGITIKPLTSASTSGMRKRQNNGTLKNSAGEVLTVEIDDEETPDVPSHQSLSPQWYLRPEEQIVNQAINEGKYDKNKIGTTKNEILSMEEKNNKEPDTSNFVEILIQDSPVKLLQPKNISEVDKVEAITIEDSPIKPIKRKHTEMKSDSEETLKTERQSKKKLDYPKVCETHEVVEIEINFNDVGPDTDNIYENANKDSCKTTDGNTRDKEIDSDASSLSNDRIKQSETKPSTENNKIKENESKFNNDDNEFHPVYQNFIDICFKLENSDDMKKIVEKKIKAYYKQSPKEYVKSEEFIGMVSSKISAINASPDKMYLYIKDIVDELNLQRKMSKSISQKTEDKFVEELTFSGGEEREFDRKKQRQIRKLEKTIKKLHRAIQKLEEQEVDFEDDEDSVYLLTERYKERMVRVHAKFCQLINTKMPSEPRIHLEVRPGHPTGPVRKLEKWINKKVPIGTPLPFPDFHDVLCCVRDANDEDKLGWNEVDIMDEARDLFTRCGKKLQRRRQENEWRLAASRITEGVDPAEVNQDLKKKLEENKSTASKREAEVLNAYVDRQNQLKLVGEEIGDKEAEESPDESDEEELTEDSNSMKNKHKRKERLKRLIQEKNTKSEDKENEAKVEGSDKKSIGKESDDDSKKQIEPENSETKTVDETNIMAVEEIEVQGDTNISEEMPSKEDEEIPSEIIENINSESDYDRVDSDPELNLLQKLHSDIESRASTVSSDSDSPIAISDSIDSDSEAENKNIYLSDVISIENSSYSESEVNDDKIPKENEKPFHCTIKSEVEDLGDVAFDEVSFIATTPTKILLKSENVEIVENVLSSSEDESTKKATDVGDDYINLKDDDITISETTITGESSEKRNLNNEEFVNENNDAKSIQDSPGDNENNMSVNESDEQEQFRESDVAMEVSHVDYCVETNESPKNDVDTHSITDINSIESIDSQVGDCINSKECRKIEADIQSITDLNSIDSVGSQSYDCVNANESPKNNADTQSLTDLNSIESVESQVGECANTNESPKNIKLIESVECQIAGCSNENESPKNYADTHSITDLNSIESVESQVDDFVNVNASSKNDIDAHSITDLNSIESVESQIGESPKIDADIQSLTQINSIENLDLQEQTKIV